MKQAKKDVQSQQNTSQTFIKTEPKKEETTINQKTEAIFLPNPSNITNIYPQNFSNPANSIPTSTNFHINIVQNLPNPSMNAAFPHFINNLNSNFVCYPNYIENS